VSTDKKIIPISKGILDPRHRKQIGIALWVFELFVDRTTKEEVIDGETWGLVYGGAPVKLQEIAECLGVSRRSARRDVRELVKYDYIRIRRIPHGLVVMVRKSIKMIHRNATFRSDTSVRSPERSDTSVRSEEKQALKGSDRTHVATPDRQDMSDVIKRSNKDIKDIYVYWKEIMKHPGAKLTPDRKQKIKARLQEGYTKEQIIRAIKGCASSPYHMGDNEQGTVYDDLTLICRNGSKLEGFMEKVKIGKREYM